MWPARRPWTSEGGRLQLEVRIRGGRHRFVDVLLEEFVCVMSWFVNARELADPTTARQFARRNHDHVGVVSGRA